MTPSAIAIIVSLGMLVAYSAIGILQYQSRRSAVSFFLDDRNLSKHAIRNTFAGAAMSVSTILVFFFTIGLSFGWQIFIAPITIALGVLGFRRIVHPRLLEAGFIRPNTATRSSRQIDSLSDAIAKLYGSRMLSFTVTAISAMGILAILVAELMVGITVLRVAHVEPEHALIAISFALLVYTGLGGMRSVVVTDRWQVLTIIISLSLVLSFFFLEVSDKTSSFLGDFLFANWTPAFSIPPALAVNITLVNLGLLPASLRVWQVVAASSSEGALRKALWESTGLLIYVSVSALLIGKSLQYILATPTITTDMLFEYLQSSGGLSAHVIYPLFVLALLSALVSTADSALLPLAQAIQSFRGTTFNHRQNFAIIGGLLGLGIAAYFIVTDVLGMGVINWILTVFSITIVIAPAIVLPLFFGPITLNRAGELLMSVGLVASCAIAVLWSIIYAEDISMQPWNCAIGMGTSTAVTGVAIWKCTRLNSDTSDQVGRP